MKEKIGLEMVKSEIRLTMPNAIRKKKKKDEIQNPNIK